MLNLTYIYSRLTRVRSRVHKIALCVILWLRVLFSLWYCCGHKVYSRDSIPTSE